MTWRNTLHRSAGSSVIAALLTLACGNSDDSGPGNAPGDALRPWYAMATAVSDDDGSSTYVQLFQDLPDGELDLSTAREFPGWSDLRVSGGKLFVSSGEGPTVWRFSVGADGQLAEDGSLGFDHYANYAHMYQQAFVNAEKAYLVGDAGEYVVWNPTTLEIVGTIPLPELPSRASIVAAPAYDRGMVVRDGLLFHAISFTDYANFAMAPSSAIVVVDIATDRVLTTLDAPCPDLNVGALDAAGHIYFSNWVYSPGATLANAGAPACVVKIPNGEATIDADWTLRFRDVTSGHEGAALSVLGDGRAVFSVFMEDNAPFDPEQDDVSAWVFGANWKSYELDLTTRDGARELTGLPWHGGGYYTARLGETDYLLLPGEGYQRTDVYELSPGGGATLSFGTQGWSTRLFEIE